MKFSLFYKEREIIRRAQQLVSEKGVDLDGVKECLITVTNALRQCCKEQKSLMRISDRQQEHLRVIKEKLLVKTRRLKQQAADLEQLNANLALEIAMRKQVEQKLRVMANTDELTGVNNRRRFIELLGLEIERAKKNQQALCLMVLDIDHFKTVNDRFGHAVGDNVLNHFAKVLSSSVREIDIIGRLGGEEFGVILPETPSEKAYIVAKRICLKIASGQIIPPAKDIKVTASIGLTQLKQGESSHQIMVRADSAMYVAKRQGRNQVVIV